ncbi:hypothetical protein GOBAR_AA23588 [Gossypium barbadense]|uniref:Uncharacterized protein n=1 Tax=Gossypium barbadense TaxID=3634 RepID=A0A2P5X156_GOSBA|nr:hypothetical protein GOBAR_AA23588 [Gossypium barbadense]
MQVYAQTGSQGSNCKGVRHVSDVLCQFYTHILYHHCIGAPHTLLTSLLIGSVVPIDAVMMSKLILQMVLVPVAFGLVLNTYAKPVVTILRPMMSFVVMISTSLYIGSPLSLNQSQILSKDGLQLVLQAKRRSLSNNIVMQWNAKLDNGRVLAIQFLGGSSQAIPVTYFVLAMAIMGLSLASFWGNGYRLRDLMSLLAPQTVHAVQEAQ